MTFSTPKFQNRGFIDDAIALVIVHANSGDDPQKVAKKRIQKLVDNDFADHIYEFIASHSSYLHHDGGWIDNNRCSTDYHIDDLAGKEYVVVGGGISRCHFGAYASLLTARYGLETTIHLPADAIYRTTEEYEGGDTYLVSELVDVSADEFSRYKAFARVVSPNYEIRQDGKRVSSAGDKRLKVMFWSETKLMMDHFMEQARMEAA